VNDYATSSGETNRSMDWVTSPADGLVLSYRTIPAARAGAWKYSMVLMVGEVGRDAPLNAAVEARR